MRILIADDEELARQRVRALVSEIGIGEIIAEASNGKDAILAARACKIDVVLLDIRMPGIDGIQVAHQLSTLQPTPVIIFTTAYGEHALDAFERQAVDYLLKPIRKERLERALRRAAALLENKLMQPAIHLVSNPSARSHISINIRGELRLIPVNQIYCFTADQKYVVLHWMHGEALIAETLKDLEKEFAGQFLRIHRRTLVALVQIISLVKDQRGQFFIKLKSLPQPFEVSRRHLPTVRKVLKDMRISCEY